VQGRARKVSVADFDRFDVIVAMDKANLRELTDLAPSKEALAKIRLFRTYDPEAVADEVPDPWGGPPTGYEETIRIVRSAARGLISEISAHTRI
jgi:protein-tyrosine phosphatase